MSVFLGWLPDAASQAALAGLRDGVAAALDPEAPRHTWRKPEQWHMTLRYLGDHVDAAQCSRIEGAMAALAADASPPQGALVGAQYWPHARVLVAKIDASDALKALLKRIESEVQACGFAKERAQTAHVTLAYLQTRDLPARLAPPPAEPTALRIDRIHLLRSVPGTYESLASWPLSCPPADA